MSKVLCLTLILIAALCFIVSPATSYAATMVSSEIPGGAAVSYFQTGAGFTTLLNIQNISNSSVLVHIQVFDRNSVHTIDFNIGLTMHDNIGLVLTGDGTQVYVSGYSDDAFGGSGQLPSTVQIPANGSDGLQYGYITATVTADGNGDRLSLFSGGCPGVNPVGVCPAPGRNGDPRTFTNFSSARNGWSMPFNVIFMRTAILDADGAIGMNAQMYSDFMNIPGPNGTAAANCNGFVNTANPAGDINTACIYSGGATNDDGNGIGIDAWENFITSYTDLRLVPANGCNNIGVACFNAQTPPSINAMGAANNIYWARFNENPDAGTHSTLITVAPANSGGLTALNNASMVWNSRTGNSISYDDDEHGASGNINLPEAALSEFGSSVSPRPDNQSIFVNSDAGEVMLTIGAPLFGFVYTEGPAFKDIFPIVRGNIAIESGSLTANDNVNDIAITNYDGN